jgi:diguanylate cyclase (GGDEF)-like protein
MRKRSGFEFSEISENPEIHKNLIKILKSDAEPELGSLRDVLAWVTTEARQKNSRAALILLELNRFKLINNSLNQIAENSFLELITQRLLSIIGSQNILAHAGGDEFIIIMPDIQAQDDAFNLTCKLLGSFKKPFDIAERTVILTGSLGISLFPKDGANADTLIQNADAALYHAKELGSNNFQFYTKEMHAHCLAELDQEMQLRQALLQSQFFLVYQPQFSLPDSKLIGVEVLLRWQHPHRGIVSPADFIPMAERTGLILSIGEWVLDAACKQNKAWQTAGYKPIRIAVNVDAQQFQQLTFMEIMHKILQESDLKPEFLEIELTENELVNNKQVIETISALKKLGISMALDDFGTGYCSLSYLKKIPLTRIKIDGSFIQNIGSPKDEAIIRAVITIAESLNLEVVAEGVETLEQLDFLKKHKCNAVQGYYYSKPVSSIEIEKLLRAFK